MLASIGSALVAGAAPNTHMVKTVRVRVLRPFLIGGKVQPVGSVIEVDFVLAAELLHAGKAETAQEQPAASATAQAKPQGKKE